MGELPLKSYIPWHWSVVISCMYPSWHRSASSHSHLYVPARFWHTCLQPPLLFAHSSMSIKMIITCGDKPENLIFWYPTMQSRLRYGLFVRHKESKIHIYFGRRNFYWQSNKVIPNTVWLQPRRVMSKYVLLVDTQLKYTRFTLQQNWA